ncbi:MAG: type II secretion system protein [Deltaproteobacteria bacterium]|nr:type II secretion system protein [Deltaproteobacteria bacterium]
MGRSTGIGRQRGYTLIELMVVLTIIGILATIAQPNLQRTVIRAREASLRQSLFVLRDVIDQFYADNGSYPDSLEDLVEKHYIRALPEDPITKSSSTWIIIPPEDAKGGVYDIHSGSDLIALNNEPYNEW